MNSRVYSDICLPEKEHCEMSKRITNIEFSIPKHLFCMSGKYMTHRLKDFHCQKNYAKTF